MDSVAEKQELQARADQLQRQNQLCIQQRLLLLASLVRIVDEQNRLKQYARLRRNDETKLVKQQQQVQELLQNIELIQTQIQQLSEQNEYLIEDNKRLRINLVANLPIPQQINKNGQNKMSSNGLSALEMSSSSSSSSSKQAQSSLIADQYLTKTRQDKQQCHLDLIQQLRSKYLSSLNQKQATIHRLKTHLQHLAPAELPLMQCDYNQIAKQLAAESKELMARIDIQTRKKQLRKAQLRQLETQHFVISCRYSNTPDRIPSSELATKQSENQKWRHNSDQEIKNLHEQSARLAKRLLVVKDNIRSSNRMAAKEVRKSESKSKLSIQESQHHELVLLKMELEKIASAYNSSEAQFIAKRCKILTRQNQYLRNQIKEMAVSSQILSRRVVYKQSKLTSNLQENKLNAQFQKIASNLKAQIKEDQQKLNQIQIKCHEVFKRAENHKPNITRTPKELEGETPLKLRKMKQEVDRLRLKSRQKMFNKDEFEQYDINKLREKLNQFKYVSKGQNQKEVQSNGEQMISRLSSKKTEDFLQRLELVKQSNRELRKFIQLNENKQ